MRRRLLQALLWLLIGLGLLFIGALLAWSAGTPYHAPTGSGTQKAGDLDASDMFWLEEWDLWIQVDNSGTGSIIVQDIDGDSVASAALDCDCCADQNNLEDGTIVAATGSDYIYVIDEGGADACVCRVDFRTWKNQGTPYAGAPSISKEWCVDGGRANIEGMAFVPGGCSSGSCEGGGHFYFANQEATTLIEAYELHVADTDVTKKGEWSHPCTSGSPTVGTDGGSLAYEWVSNALYLTDDNSSNSACVFTPRRCSGNTQNCSVDGDCPGVETCSAFVRIGSFDLGTGGEIEGLGICPACGFSYYVVDTGGGTYNNGTYRFADSFCGDGITSSAETCDDGNQTDNDGCEFEPGVYCTVTSGWECSGTPSTCNLLQTTKILGRKT